MMEATVALRHGTIPALLTIAGVMSAAYGQQEKLTWADAVDYVAQHGSASSFYGPVAASLGLSNGTTVDYRLISKPGNPSRDFYVTPNAVVVSITWRSGANRGYTATKQGVLQQAVDRNRSIPIAEATGAFEAEKSWWIATITADRAKTGL
jgi:hypothetical protein